MKIGDRELSWVLLHFRNGEMIAGLIEGPKDITPDDKHYKKSMAADLMQSRVYVHSEARGDEQDAYADHLVEVLNPHQVLMSFQGGQRGLVCSPLDLGDRVVHVRAGEILYPQFMDDKSPVVVEIRKGMSGIVAPGDEARTAGGLIIPGSGTKV